MSLLTINTTNSREYSPSYRYYEVFETEDDWVLFLSRYTTCTDPDKVSVLALYLRNRYYTSNINYDTKEAFYRHFGLTFTNLYRRYIKQMEIIDLQYNLSEEEIITIGIGIDNVASADARQVTNPLNDVIDYIDAQSSSRRVNNKLTAYLSALYRLSDELVFDFVDQFKSHFTSVYYTDIVDPTISYEESGE